MEKIAKAFLVAGCVIAVIVSAFFCGNYFDSTQGFKINSELFDHFGSFFGGVVGALLTFSSVLYLVETFREQRKEGIERRFFELLRYNRELLVSVDQEVFKLTRKPFFEYYFSARMELFAYWSEIWPEYVIIDGVWPEYVAQVQVVNGVQTKQEPLFESESLKEHVANFVIINGFRNPLVSNDTPLASHSKLMSENEKAKEPSVSNLIGKAKSDFILYGWKSEELSHITVKSKGVILTRNGEKWYGDERPDFPAIGNILNRYYRNLIHLVRFINNNSLLSYDEKYEHIRTLRSLMSDEEQVLLFYNAISEAGKGWGVGSANVNLDLVTKYNLVKNAVPLITNEVIRGYFPNIELQGDNTKSDERKKLEQSYRELKPRK
jgi:Putative phage abortive infection protein